jgi:tetraprenyl-beta-curcumene synthase
MRQWRRRAQAIIDGPIRIDALSVLSRKRTHVDGAALFWTTLPRRRPRLLWLLVAYELLLDFLDYAGERAQDVDRDLRAGQANGERLHRGLLDALDPTTEIVDHYALHPWRADVGYMRALIFSCRLHTAALPSYSPVRPFMVAEARRAAQILSINHIPDPACRDRRLRAWAAQHRDLAPDLEWFELTAAVSGSLAIHALLAQAADETATRAQIEETFHAYMPWVALATAMFDSYADQIEDAALDGHSYIAHYAAPAVADSRLQQIASQTMHATLTLSRGTRHTILVACMIAMYLSRDDVRSPGLAGRTRALARAGGPLTRSLLPVLGIWRAAVSHRAS